jgi:hypothetical protein
MVWIHLVQNTNNDRSKELSDSIKCRNIFLPAPETIVSLDSSVGVITRYGLEGPGIESRFGRDFPHPS